MCLLSRAAKAQTNGLGCLPLNDSSYNGRCSFRPRTGTSTSTPPASSMVTHKRETTASLSPAITARLIASTLAKVKTISLGSLPTSAGVGEAVTTQRHSMLVETLAELAPGCELAVVGKRGEHADFAKGHLGGTFERVLCIGRTLFILDRLHRVELHRPVKADSTRVKRGMRWPVPHPLPVTMHNHVRRREGKRFAGVQRIKDAAD